MTALRTTFYSYKGGVGRTLALLNVGYLLASNGRRVVAIDFDLEAPGFGLSSLTRQSREGIVLGVSDLLYDRFHGGQHDFRDYCYPLPIPKVSRGGEFSLIPVGTLPGWLTSIVPDLYRDPSSEKGELFPLLLDEIEAALSPDFILFDSRTGRAEIAGVALLELPQVVVGVSGLSEQNTSGMRAILERLRARPGGNEGPLTLLALSPVPTGPAPSETREAGSFERLLTIRIDDAKATLLAPIQEDFARSVRPRFPQLSDSELFHLLPYDPLVPLTDELQITRATSLTSAYRRLADVVARARSGDPGLPDFAERSAL